MKANVPQSPNVFLLALSAKIRAICGFTPLLRIINPRSVKAVPMMSGGSYSYS